MTQNCHSHKYVGSFKADILAEIEKLLLEKYMAGKQKVIDETALKHMKLTGSMAAFRQDKVLYVHQIVNVQPFQTLRLHPTLVEQFNEQTFVWGVHVDRQHLVRAVIISALNTMGNTRDLRELLPECVHSVLPAFDSDECHLTPLEVAEFKTTNATNLSLISFQLIMQTIKA
jgi:hypothetical protein